ncbi:hypothetical protein [Streptomyces sp. NPDC001137]|uniref:hypothetical protein n=1 Tax=Streptomyces sp. NPDC001137 TaxID=3154378 RepID=UPI00332320AB
MATRLTELVVTEGRSAAGSRRRPWRTGTDERGGRGESGESTRRRAYGRSGPGGA